MFDPGAGNYGYMWTGLTPGQQTEDKNIRDMVGKMSQIFMIPNDTRKSDIFLYSEFCFIAAEATERFGSLGLNSTGKSAQQWYEDGIRESFKKWRFLNEIGDFNNQLVIDYTKSTDKNLWGTSVLYTDDQGKGNTKLEKIITQKYIASYPDLSLGIWNDKRRLNLPALLIPDYRDGGAGTYPSDGNIQNPKNYIQRTVYPQSEKLINETNYKAGVAQLRDGDKTSSPLWWASKQSNYCTSDNN